MTIDAMGTQKAIAEEVIRGKADYVLAGAEGEPRVAASGGHRAHRRAAGRGPRGGRGADDERPRARPL